MAPPSEVLECDAGDPEVPADAPGEAIGLAGAGGGEVIDLGGERPEDVIARIRGRGAQHENGLALIQEEHKKALERIEELEEQVAELTRALEELEAFGLCGIDEIRIRAYERARRVLKEGEKGE